ncbi:hypothetical protein J3R83DRAFT_5478 [Lanmaoa asiatica]|nr:hypothetical protein J3R83DRAFT_5478 [Lanmaoa asiatica]
MGGHTNHSLFWTNLAPSAAEGKGNGRMNKDGPFKTAIDATLGSSNAFKEFNATTVAIQGSGCGWFIRFLSMIVALSFSAELPTFFCCRHGMDAVHQLQEQDARDRSDI